MQFNEIGRPNNAQFGTLGAVTAIDPNLKRDKNWTYELTGSHELFPNVSVGGGYFYRHYFALIIPLKYHITVGGNFQIFDAPGSGLFLTPPYFSAIYPVNAAAAGIPAITGGQTTPGSISVNLLQPNSIYLPGLPVPGPSRPAFRVSARSRTQNHSNNSLTTHIQKPCTKKTYSFCLIQAAASLVVSAPLIWFLDELFAVLLRSLLLVSLPG